MEHQQVSIGLPNHALALAYLRVVGRVCGDKAIATLATIWAKNL